MTDLSAGEQKVVDYLSEAHANERRLATVLGEHAAITQLVAYRKRLQQHEKQTRAHAQALERRIKQLGGSVNEGIAARAPEAVQTAQTMARRAASLALGGLDAVRGTSDQEKLVRNARAEYEEEASEIARYAALEALAESLADRETTKLARSIRRDEEHMAQFLFDVIPQLVRAAVEEEIAPPQPVAKATSRRGAPKSATSSGAARKTSATTSARKPATPAKNRTKPASKSTARSRASSPGTK